MTLFVSYGAARVTVRDGVLGAGRARIPVTQLGTVEALDAEATRLLAGREADARAYLLIRPYVHRGVKVDVVDPADPAPYWLLSSRHPDRLARRARRGPRGLGRRDRHHPDPGWVRPSTTPVGGTT